MICVIAKVALALVALNVAIVVFALVMAGASKWCGGKRRIQT